MRYRGAVRGIIKTQHILLLGLLFPLILHASFIESTLGTAVVNDATAAYYNPAALTLLSNAQAIALGSIATSHTRFTGKAIQTATGFTQMGSAPDQTHYYLPSLYLGAPTTDKMTLGLAVVSNFFNRNIEENSILRYAQSSNSIHDIDLVPALGFKINDHFSLGAGISLSQVNFLLEPISGFPSLNIPDAESHNEANASGFGGDIGFLLKPSRATLIGFNYRSSVTYRFKGQSIFEDNSPVISNNYSFTFWTPARSVLSINHFVTSSLGFIATVQHIQWSIFNEIKIHGVATKIGAQPMILNADVPYHLRDSWLFTVGSHYRLSPKWIIRVAGNYNQTPGNGYYQISSGDGIILGASMSYQLYKNILIDGSFAHAFIQNQTINIRGVRNLVSGENRAFRDAFSLKMTFNF
ncbi:OmpP1/FadL family transporter [Legionella maioricensis]|uniref:Outer membrane protein transport protein n=1 Tax=Legionella maioricensis TaxID=2896528 RepID=A0A9X2IBR6_9GAMM|nr:outer membrane protein transport protein [Legionella maioricensis]MCL9685129.1 outer membrane protein transport protein [Legionella maioricensis]MCL9688358.1 outer membrane protein transport protein [Legionella maioricensis]